VNLIQLENGKSVRVIGTDGGITTKALVSSAREGTREIPHVLYPSGDIIIISEAHGGSGSFSWTGCGQVDIKGNKFSVNTFDCIGNAQITCRDIFTGETSTIKFTVAYPNQIKPAKSTQRFNFVQGESSLIEFFLYYDDEIYPSWTLPQNLAGEVVVQPNDLLEPIESGSNSLLHQINTTVPIDTTFSLTLNFDPNNPITFNQRIVIKERFEHPPKELSAEFCAETVLFYPPDSLEFSCTSRDPSIVQIKDRFKLLGMQVGNSVVDCKIFGENADSHQTQVTVLAPKHFDLSLDIQPNQNAIKGTEMRGLLDLIDKSILPNLEHCPLNIKWSISNNHEASDDQMKMSPLKKDFGLAERTGEFVVTATALWGSTEVSVTESVTIHGDFMGAMYQIVIVLLCTFLLVYYLSFKLN